MTINYIEGDATYPICDDKDNQLIIHCCNDVGAWGSGFVLALNKRWDSPKRDYQRWAVTRVTKENLPNVTGDFRLGQIQDVWVEPGLCVVNMIGQRDIGIQNFEFNGKSFKHPPVNYTAIRECLFRTAQLACDHNASIHCPRFGSGLAGGKWNLIEKDIHEILVDGAGRDVTVYDYVG